jgi:ESCRT-I complex subunit TSG101
LKDACERDIAALKECIQNSQTIIEWARNRGEISGDELVCAQTLVYDQYFPQIASFNFRLFNLVAEDLAIEDTMEILAKALDYERISLDIFLKVHPYLSKLTERKLVN